MYYRLFFCLLVWIYVASLIDMMLTVMAMPHLDEQNPVCDWLIQKGGTEAFVMSKMMSGLLVLLILTTMWQYRRKWAWVSAVSLSLFQGWLLHYCVT